MAGISNYLADKIGDWMHGNTGGYTPVGTTYFALMTAMPTASGGGTEVTGGSYVRKAVTNNSTNWPASASGVKSNGVAITWVTPTADWGLALGVAEYDASTGGNLLTFALLATATTVLNGQPFSLSPLSAVFRWKGGISTYLTNKLNDWLHGGGTYTVPTPTYFAFDTVGPKTLANDGSDTSGTETSGGSYARVSDTNNATNWPNSVAQTKSNANALTWSAATTDWTGPEVVVTEFDASTVGNVLTFGAIPTPVTVASGATPSVPINAAVYQVQ